jgi:hypothetical protein
MRAFGIFFSFVVFGIYETMSSIYLFIISSGLRKYDSSCEKAQEEKKRDMSFALDGFWLFIFSRHTLSVPK